MLFVIILCTVEADGDSERHQWRHSGQHVESSWSCQEARSQSHTKPLHHRALLHGLLDSSVHH